MEKRPHRLVRAALPRVLALMLCLPLVGGRGLAVMVDMLVYPRGACCCERAHGAPHHCRCAEAHDAEEADAAHQLDACPDQWDDGGLEFNAPDLWEMPPATLALGVELRPAVIAHRPPQDAPLLEDALPAPPPTPPPNVAQV